MVCRITKVGSGKGLKFCGFLVNVIEKRSLCYVTIVAKFLDLNKPWS